MDNQIIQQFVTSPFQINTLSDSTIDDVVFHRQTIRAVYSNTDIVSVVERTAVNKWFVAMGDITNAEETQREPNKGNYKKKSNKTMYVSR